MKSPTSTSTQPSCTIRPFEAGDRPELLSLYETVFGRDRSSEWFRWKFVDNPYVDHVPIIVAEADGRLVGCRAFFAQEMRIGDAVRIAFQPCDTMVHPAYREQGLFSRMNEHALERYADRSPSFCFNFPNEQSKPGNLKHGWQEIGTFPVYYRPQDPVGSVRKLARGGDDETSDADAIDGSGTGAENIGVDDIDGGIDERTHRDDTVDDTASGVTHALSGVITSSQQAGDRLVTQSDSELDVVRFETPPAALLESVYRRAIPDGIHTNRTAAFYRWRFENPAQRYTTYVATRDGETPVAALVLSQVDDHLRIIETLPRTVDTEQGAINQLLVTALGEYPDRNYVTAFGETLPTPIRYRFYPDTRFPLSTLVQPTSRTLLARDLNDGTGLEDTVVDDWALSRLDLDTT